MYDYNSDDLHAALAPIASLLSKSEKAQQKLEPGCWQHKMLDENIRALRIAYALMNRSIENAAAGPESFTRDELQQATDALESMIGRTENVRTKFAPGTSQHTLQRNRLNALRIAEALVQAERDSGPA